MPEDNNDEFDDDLGDLGTHSEDPDPAGPCRFIPGTPEKVAALELRRAQGWALWHPDDAVNDTERDGPLLGRRGIGVDVQRDPFWFWVRDRAARTRREDD
jgi:hypothetical protein